MCLGSNNFCSQTMPLNTEYYIGDYIINEKDEITQILKYHKFMNDLREWEIDLCIAPLVLKINNDCIKTISSCCGHGKIEPHIMIDPRYSYMAISKGYTVFKQDCFEEGGNIRYFIDVDNLPPHKLLTI